MISVPGISSSSSVVRISVRRLQLQRSLAITRRWGSTEPDKEKRQQQPSPEAAGTEKHINIPVPGSYAWLEPVTRPFYAYGRAQARRPYLVQILSSLAIWFLGDISAQSISPAGPDGTYSPHRTARSLIVGALISIPNYRWFIFLGECFNYRSRILSLAAKIVVNQICFTPVFNTYFFGMHSLLSGATWGEMVERVGHTVPVSWWNSCKLWPAVTAFSFTFIPPAFRSVFAGCVAIGWQTWLTLINQRAAEFEEAEHARLQREQDLPPSAAST